MSKYSGKCDFADTWEILGDRMKNAKVYYGNNIVPLRIDNVKDAMPYFPFIVSSMASSEETTTIYLAERSYVDETNERWMDSCWKTVKKAYKKRAKNGVPTIDDILTAIGDTAWNRETYEKMASALVSSGGKGDRPKNLFAPCLEHYRTSLYEDLVSAGYDENIAYRWVYGFDNWLERYKNSKAKE